MKALRAGAVTVALCALAALPVAAQTAHSSGGNFGSVNVGAPAAPVTVTFTFDTAGTLGSTLVVTQGATGLDYADAGTGSCQAGTSYNVADTCTVDVNFKPLHPGGRYGAVELLDNSGNLVGTGYVNGIGVGPQVVFANSTSGLLVPGKEIGIVTAGSPDSVATDASGNIFVVKGGVEEFFAVNGSIHASPRSQSLKNAPAINTGSNCIAVDGAGNLFLAEAYGGGVQEMMAVGGYTTVKTLGGGFAFFDPQGVAVDGSGNVFLADLKVYELPASDGYTTVQPLTAEYHMWGGIAVDAVGNLFVSDYDNEYEITASSGYTDIEMLAEDGDVTSVAVDASDDLFFGAIHTAYEVPAAGGYSTAEPLPEATGDRDFGLAVDQSGNVVAADGEWEDPRFFYFGYASPPSLTFTNSKRALVSNGPQTVTVSNDGNADLIFPVPASGSNPSIAEGFSLTPATTCPQVSSSSAEPGTLAAGASCVYVVNFTPASVGVYSGSLTLTDTSLNAAAPGYSTQSIGLSGTPKPPVVSLATALDNITFNNTVRQSDSVEVTGWAADFDDGSPMTNLGVYIDGNLAAGTFTTGLDSAGFALANGDPAFGHAGFRFLTPAAGLSPGPHLLKVVATNSYGVPTTSNVLGFTVADSASTASPVGWPLIVVDGSTGSRPVNSGDNLQVTGWAADLQDGSPLPNLKVYIDGKLTSGTLNNGLPSPGFAAFYKNAAFGHAQFQILIPTAAMSLGIHAVKVVATNSLGLSSTFGPVRFSVAVSANSGPPAGWPPTAVDDTTGSATVSQKHNLRVTGWVADPQDGSPMTNVKVYIDGLLASGTLTTDLPSPGFAATYNNSAYAHARIQFLAPVSSLSVGTHWVTVLATNSKGISSRFGPTLFTVEQ